MDDLTTTGIAGGSGLIGAILGWLGFKSRIAKVEQDVSDFSKTVRYEVTCLEIHRAVEIQLKDIRDLSKESRDDIKKLLQRK